MSDSELGNLESNRIYGIFTNFTPPPGMWHPLSIINAQSVSLGMGLFTKFFWHVNDSEVLKHVLQKEGRRYLINFNTDKMLLRSKNEK